MKRSILISLLFLAGHVAGADLNAGKIADAIYRAEGGPRAKAPYGILAVKVRNTAHARRICIRTIEHAWGDYSTQKRSQPFIHFLADRYCPPSADPIGNRNWKRNVTLLCR